MKDKLLNNIKKLTTIFSIAILIITVSILVIKLTVFNSSDPSAKATTSKTTNVEGDLVFNYSISDTITFTNFDATANPKIKTESNNTAMLQVKIIRDETKRSVYVSNYIRPGDNQNAIKLQGEYLPAGSYDCTAEMIALDLTSREVINTYNVPITLVITEDVPGKGAATDEGNPGKETDSDGDNPDNPEENPKDSDGANSNANTGSATNG